MSLSDESSSDFSLQSNSLGKNEAIRSNLELLNDKMKNSTQIVSNYCSFLRDNIEVRTESLINSVNQLNAIFMCQVDEFENKTLAIMGENDKFKEEFETFYKESNELLNSSELEPAQAARLKALIEDKNEEMDKEFLFNQKKLIFEESDHDISLYDFGTLHEEQENRDIQKFNIRKLFDLNSLNFDSLEILRVNILKNGHFVFAFRYKSEADSEKCIHLLKTDSLLRILRQIKSELGHTPHKIADFKLITHENKIVLQLINMNKSRNTLVIYDADFNCLGSIKTEFYFENIQCTNEMIVCRYDTGKGSFYKSYNWTNLEQVENLVLENLPDKKRCLVMLIANCKYIFRFRLHSETCTYSTDGRLLERNRLIPYDPFTTYLVNSKERIICLNRKGLVVYAKNGQLIGEKRFDSTSFTSNRFENANIFLDRNDALYLYSFHDGQYNLYRLNKLF